MTEEALSCKEQLMREKLAKEGFRKDDALLYSPYAPL
jgi:hypothetical protein